MFSRVRTLAYTCPFPHPLYPRKRAIATASATAQLPLPSSIDETSVHPQETSEQPTPFQSYHDRCVFTMRPEYDATDEMYRDLDRRDRKIRSFDLSQCRSDAWLAVSKRSRKVIVLSNSCRLRWCPLCSKRKARLIAESVAAWLQNHPHPKILTLTLKHSTDSLDSQISRLYACFRELRRRKYYKTHIRGGIWFFQVKWMPKTQSWHPHVHCLMDSEYIPHDYLKETWKAITGDSEIVDIRVIYKVRTASEYVARYAARPAKLAEMPRNRRSEVHDALHSRRLCGKWGTAREIVFSEATDSEIADYKPIARFERMARHVASSSWARILWDSYVSGEPVPICYDLTEIDSFDAFDNSPIIIEPPPGSSQLRLF